MDEGRREEVNDLGEDVGEKRDRPVVNGEDALGDPPPGPDLDGVRRVPELGVGREGRLRVPGHLDLGDDGDEALRRVADDLADVVLRVEAAVRGSVALVAVAAAISTLRGVEVSR